MKRQRWSTGGILRIPLGNGWHAYAWMLADPEFAVFDSRAKKELAIEEIITRHVLFRVWVHQSAWTTGHWLRVGKAAVPRELLKPVARFMQDPINGQLNIYVNGRRRPATHRECEGLECAAVWDPEHVEDRLRDHWAGVPNDWLVSLKPR